MIKKIMVVSSCFSAFLAFQRSWFVLVSLTVAVLCGYEALTREKIRQNHRDKTVGKLKSQLTSLPYSELEFNKQFLSVMGSKKQKAARFEQKKNISSFLINYIDGIRKTSFVQSHQVIGPKIRLFGGSTIDCQEVPDDYTIASQLQEQINSTPPPLNNFEVINYGVSGATLNANYQHFRQIDIFKGDICLFFFGANEREFPSEFFKTRRLSGIPKIRQIGDLLKRLELISLYRIFEKFLTFDENDPLLNKKVQDAEQILSSINARCQTQEVLFIVILQPLLHTRMPLTKFDRAKSYYHPKTSFNFQLFLFEKFVNRLKSKSFFFDGRGIFNETDLDVYIDWVHTNYLGNKIIADYFYSVIQQQLQKS